MAGSLIEQENGRIQILHNRTSIRAIGWVLLAVAALLLWEFVQSLAAGNAALGSFAAAVFGSLFALVGSFLAALRDGADINLSDRTVRIWDRSVFLNRTTEFRAAETDIIIIDEPRLASGQSVAPGSGAAGLTYVIRLESMPIDQDFYIGDASAVEHAAKQIADALQLEVSDRRAE